MRGARLSASDTLDELTKELLTSERVNVDTGNPLESRVEGLDELLLHQVVNADMSLSL